MYNKKHGETDEELYNYLENLYEISTKKYINTILKESTCFEIKKDLKKIYEYTGFIEDFVLEKIPKDNDYNNNINKLKRLKSIYILDHRRRKICSAIYYKDYIEMNPEISEVDSKKLLYNKFSHNIDKVIK